MGSVVVRGGQQQGINYVVHTRSYSSSEQDARRQFESFKVTAYVKGDTAWIVGDWQGRRPRKCSGEFTINVPRDMGWMKLETEGGNVDATGISGRVEAESGGGSMRLDDIGGGVSAQTGGGSISVGTISGDIGLHTGGGSIQVRHANGKVVAETGGGSVEIQSGAQGASIETGGGSIEVRQCSGKVKASTGGGSIDLGDIDGPAEIDTGGGSIHLTSAKGHVSASTGGGGIELFGVPSARAETGAGGIVVKLINTGGERRRFRYSRPPPATSRFTSHPMLRSRCAPVSTWPTATALTPIFRIFTSPVKADQWGPKTLTAEGKLNGGGPVAESAHHHRRHLFQACESLGKNGGWVHPASSNHPRGIGHAPNTCCRPLLLLPLLLNVSARRAVLVGGPAGEHWIFSSEDSGTAAYLGVDIMDVNSDRLEALKLKEEAGVEVTMVDQDAPAGKAGLKEHDVILTMNGTPIESKAQLQRMIHETPPGRLVTLGISRDGQAMTIKVQLADRRKEFSYVAPKSKDFHVEIPPIPNLPDFDGAIVRDGALLGAQRPDGGEHYAPTGRVFRCEEWKWSAGAVSGERQPRRKSRLAGGRCHRAGRGSTGTRHQ